MKGDLSMSTKKEKSVNVKYRDSLFRMLFGTDKKIALELYNAVNDTKYTNPNDLEINTLQDVIYMKMKNDLSFIIGSELNLYEHQSRVNPNMPLRGLMYISELYNQIYGDNPRIYDRTLLKIPTPKYLVFYNGDDNKWSEDCIKLKLSDSFSEPLPLNEVGDYEWTATVININRGRNDSIKERSKTLYQYCYFVDAVKENAKNMPFEKAIDEAVKECISKDILADFLMVHRKEVKLMCLTEFNEQKYIDMIRDDGRVEGRIEGKIEGAADKLVTLVESFSSNHNISLEEACEELGVAFSEYEEAQSVIAKVC
jgi:hypothetical protein